MEVVQAGMPVVFIGHGSPVNALEDNDATRSWYRIARQIPRPRAILSISAHWCTDGCAVTAMEQPATIHDFGRSLPAALFQLRYPAPGSPDLARQVRELLAPLCVREDTSWGLDHGTWGVLLKAFPEADIPVVQLSMDLGKPLQWHFELGQHLRPLRDQGVLIMGTGNIVHNLPAMSGPADAVPYGWAQRFNDYIKNNIVRNDPEAVWDYQRFGPQAILAVPGLDHFCPLMYVLGARQDSDNTSFETDYLVHKALSMTSVVFANFDPGAPAR